MATRRELEQLDAARDCAICGCVLAVDRATNYAPEGAHDPTATPYYILEELFGYFTFTKRTRLLDVGCGAGRALAYFVEQGFPGKTVGVELDPELAGYAAEWSGGFPQVSVKNASVLDIDLSEFTDFYLFNPFDSYVLAQLLDKIEREVRHPITLVHMSDNGESYGYLGRPGWRAVAQDEFQIHQGALVYDCPQHCTVWEYSRA